VVNAREEINPGHGSRRIIEPRAAKNQLVTSCHPPVPRNTPLRDRLDGEMPPRTSPVYRQIYGSPRESAKKNPKRRRQGIFDNEAISFLLSRIAARYGHEDLAEVFRAPISRLARRGTRDSGSEELKNGRVFRNRYRRLIFTSVSATPGRSGQLSATARAEARGTPICEVRVVMIGRSPGVQAASKNESGAQLHPAPFQNFFAHRI
jgi:hypothetical protein